MDEAKTHYQTLGVEQDASPAEIKRAYRSLIRQFHPDVAGPDGAARTAEISAAYEVLSRPDRREEYDRSLRRPADPPADEPDPGFQDGWGAPADWDEETLDDVVVEDEPATDQRGRPYDDPQHRHDDPQHRHYDPPPVAEPVPGVGLQQPPPAPMPTTGEPAFVPPLQRLPEPPRRRPRWITWWMIGFSVPAVLTIGFVVLGLVLSAQQGQPQGPGLLIFLIIFWAVVIAAPATMHRLTAPKDGGSGQLATDLLPEPALREPVHGGPITEAGRRTELLLRTSVLPGWPAARLIHRLQQPGVDPDDLDQLLLVGRTMIIIRSELWQDGHYWWNGSQLQRQGRELAPFRIGAAVEILRHAYPGVRVLGAVVLHGPDGRLDRPLIENAGPVAPVGPQAVPVLNPAGLLDFLHQVLATTPDRDVVDAGLLAALLRRP